MLHKEYVVGYGVVDGTLSPLANDVGRLTNIPPWTLWILEVGDEIHGFSMTINMTMRWGEIGSLSVTVTSYSTKSKVLGRGGLKWGKGLSSITSTSTCGLCDNGLSNSTKVVTYEVKSKWRL